MIPNPIHKVLLTFQNCGVRALLMGGQACVFYGAAEFSRQADYAARSGTPCSAQVEFWLGQGRTPELLIELAREFPAQAESLATHSRPLLHAALKGNQAEIEGLLAGEEHAERTLDRAYWAPLKRELESMRQARRSPEGL